MSRFNDVHTFQAPDGWNLCSTCGRPFNTGYANFKHVRDPDGWQPMETAPKNATWIDVILEDGMELEAHWSEDMSGEFQPKYAGWFIRRVDIDNPKIITGYQEIHDPIGWREI